MKSSAFDWFGIRQECWNDCDADPNSYNDGSMLPPYRDLATTKQFFEVGKFFICVDVCESGYVGNRIAFIVPMVLMGTVLFATICCCLCCKNCWCNRQFVRRSKDAHLLSASSSSTLPLEKSGLPPVDTTERNKKKWAGLYIVSSKVSDINQARGGTSSVNSWITDEDSDHGKSNRKGSERENQGERRKRINETAQKLGQRLIELDRKSEEKEEIKRQKVRQRNNTFQQEPETFKDQKTMKKH